MPSHEPRVLLRDASGREAPGHLLGVTQGGGDGRVCVVLDDARRMVLALGGAAELELLPAEGQRPVLLRGRVLQHRVGRDAGWYVLEIDVCDRHLLAGGKDRRQHLRGHPEASAPIVARLSAPDGSLARQARVKDLSEGGAGLLVRPPEDLELLAQTRLRVALPLVGDEPPTELLARLVFRRQSGSLLHYGLAFDALATPGFDQAREQVAAWVHASEPSRQDPDQLPTLRAG